MSETIKSITNCPTCGVECKIGGNGTTHFYIPQPKEGEINTLPKDNSILTDSSLINWFSEDEMKEMSLSNCPVFESPIDGKDLNLASRTAFMVALKNIQSELQQRIKPIAPKEEQPEKIVSEDETFEFDTTALSKKEQLEFQMLLNSGVKIKSVGQSKEVEELKKKEILGDRKIVQLEHEKTVLKSEVEKAKELLSELVRLKRIKDNVGKTLEYTECMPIAWRESIEFLEGTKTK